MREGGPSSLCYLKRHHCSPHKVTTLSNTALLSPPSALHQKGEAAALAPSRPSTWQPRGSPTATSNPCIPSLTIMVLSVLYQLPTQNSEVWAAALDFPHCKLVVCIHPEWCGKHAYQLIIAIASIRSC